MVKGEYCYDFRIEFIPGCVNDVAEGFRVNMYEMNMYEMN
jgi:hypothetical protein